MALQSNTHASLLSISALDPLRTLYIKRPALDVVDTLVSLDENRVVVSKGVVLDRGVGLVGSR